MTPSTVPPDFAPSPPVNLRDLGGIPIEGGVVGAGFAIRADDLAVITDEAAHELVGNGLTTVIDLRSREEVANTGRGPLAASHVAYHHLSLVANLGATFSEGRAMAMDPVAFGEHYAELTETAAPQLVSALAIIAFSPGTTAFHCAAGKDRTGVVAALLLLALGAEDADVVADYARTGDNVRAIRERLGPVMSGLLASFGFDRDTFTAAAAKDDFSAEPMDVMLARLRERHGDPLAPLKAAGLGEELVMRLRTRARGR